MTNSLSTVTLNQDFVFNLSEEMAHVAKMLAKLSMTLKKLSLKKVPTVEISEKTDPEMFSENFLKTIRRSRQEFAKGEYLSYEEFRQKLNLS